MGVFTHACQGNGHTAGTGTSGLVSFGIGIRTEQTDRKKNVLERRMFLKEESKFL